jgi:alkanesulfonate monooxygenase SsuD/methylene tetrahydromethanopterin reductase-like flavin-dependent oxidoreductase (luciferase family)
VTQGLHVQAGTGEPRLDFGVALDFGSSRHPLGEAASRLRPIVRQAEDLGFSGIWAGEVYSPVPGAWAAPSSLAVLSWVAAQTSTIGLGAGVLLLPAWHPLRLSYDAVTLDQLSGGRLTLGLGFGSQQLWKRFGHVGSPADLMDRHIGAVRAFLGSDEQGVADDQPVEGPVLPRPVQRRGPGILVGGLARRASLRAARCDGWYGASNHLLDAHIRPAVQRYKEALAQKPSESPHRVAVNRIAFIAPTTVAAESGRRYCAELLGRYAAFGALLDGQGRSVTATPELLEAMVDDLCLIGTPEQVNERLAAYVDAGVTEVQLRLAMSDMPLELVHRSLELAADQVLGEWR